jgi:ribokinase
LKNYEATVLHDFFVDRYVVAEDLDGLIRSIEEKSREGGGGIHDVSQREMRGGNAVNMAHALSRLGTRTYLITHTDEGHEGLLREAFAGFDTKLSLKRTPPGLTVAFEGRTGGARNRQTRGKVNVMLNSLGGTGDFPPSALDEEDWRVVKNSRVVCSVNWAANRHGTELVQEIRRRVKRKTLVFLDPADVRDRIARYRRLLAIMKREHLVDWLSTNEFEAKVTGKLLGVPTDRLDLLAKRVSSELAIRFDIHSETESHTSDGIEVHSHVVTKVVPRVLTGAGDVWNATSVHFYLKGVPDDERIILADLAAGMYLRTKDSVGPKESEVLSFFEHS